MSRVLNGFGLAPYRRQHTARYIWFLYLLADRRSDHPDWAACLAARLFFHLNPFSGRWLLASSDASCRRELPQEHSEKYVSTVVLFLPAAVSVSLPTVRETSESLPSESGREILSSLVRFLLSSLIVLSFTSPTSQLPLESGCSNVFFTSTRVVSTALLQLSRLQGWVQTRHCRRAGKSWFSSPARPGLSFLCPRPRVAQPEDFRSHQNSRSCVPP